MELVHKNAAAAQTSNVCLRSIALIAPSARNIARLCLRRSRKDGPAIRAPLSTGDLVTQHSSAKSPMIQYRHLAKHSMDAVVMKNVEIPSFA
jgi:hypothetical protein